MNTPQKMCPRCQMVVMLNTAQCPRCGHAFRTQFVPPPNFNQTQVFNPQAMAPGPAFMDGRNIRVIPGTHSVFLAVLLSFLITGAGQIYNKQTTKGVTMLVSAIVASIVLSFFALVTMGLGFVLVLALPVFWIIQIIDAGMVASRLNRGEVVSVSQWF